ncbi:MAG: ZIP family metal transporter [Planctomycetota bacterium]
MDWLTSSSVLIFAIALVGGVVPLVLRRTERVQHLMIAFAAGVFLGAVFLHLLPEIAGMAAGATADAEHHGHAHPHGDDADHQGAGHHLGRGHLLWLCVLLGVLLLFLIENLLLRGAPRSGEAAAESQDRHRTVGWATLFGLSVHAFTAGLGLSAGVQMEALQGPLLVSVVSHKAVEGFSLGAAFLLAGMPRRRVLVLVLLFALVTPAGALSRVLLAPEMTGLGLQVFTALAAGTFLFVAICDLLPEVFHHRQDTAAKVVLLIAGIGVDLIVHSVVE